MKTETQVKHTPGPWKVNVGDFETHISANGKTIVWSVVGIGDEYLANASLIAAAPELLEACKKELELISSKWPNSTLLNNLERVIKLAEGNL